MPWGERLAPSALECEKWRDSWGLGDALGRVGRSRALGANSGGNRGATCDRHWEWVSPQDFVAFCWTGPRCCGYYPSSGVAPHPPEDALRFVDQE